MKILHEYDGSKTGVVTFHWRDTNIWLGETLDRDGNKSLTIRVGGVGAAVHITGLNMANWTISILAESSQGVGVTSQDAASICVGPAPSATEKDT